MRIAMFAFVAMLACSAVFAEAMMVTVSFESGHLSLRHAELISGQPQGVTNDGPFLLAYKKGGDVVPATRFYMPILVLSDKANAAPDSAEYTLSMPVVQGAESILLYNANGSVVSALGISSIKSAGDSVGEAPRESMAGKLGEKSVAAAVDEASGIGSGAGQASQGNAQGKQGCLPLLVLAIVGMAAFVSRR